MRSYRKNRTEVKQSKTERGPEEKGNDERGRKEEGKGVKITVKEIKKEGKLDSYKKDGSEEE